MTSETTQETLPDDVVGMPPSARFVFRELARTDRPLPLRELEPRTGYNTETVRKALAMLCESGAVEARTSLKDARRRVYSIAE